MTPMGMQLADRLGEDYLVIGMTSGTGQTLNNGADFYSGKLFTELEPPDVQDAFTRWLSTPREN